MAKTVLTPIDRVTMITALNLRQLRELISLIESSPSLDRCPSLSTVDLTRAEGLGSKRSHWVAHRSRVV